MARLTGSQTPKKLLEEARDRRFIDGSSQLVVVIGSGLHFHLAEHGVDYSKRGLLQNWIKLIGSALQDDIDRCADAEERRVLDARKRAATAHDDAAAAWESLLTARSSYSPASKRQSNKQEEVLSKRILRSTSNMTPNRAEVVRFGAALDSHVYRDIICLNFDRTLDRASSSRGRKVKFTSIPRNPAGVRESIHVHLDGQRVWHPHGIASEPGDLDLPRSPQLGTRSYTLTTAAIVRGIDRLRTRWKGRVPSLEVLRRTGATSLAWWATMLTSDVAFIGCGLDRAELDLWLVLHERQRQLAQVPEDQKPRAFFLHPLAGFPRHVASRPAGLMPVVTETYDEAWALLFGKWWA